MDAEEEPDRPPSLDLTDLGPDRVRGQLRPARDPTKTRRLVWGGLGSVLLMAAAINLPDPTLMAATYVAGFLVLGWTAWNLTGIITLPVTIQLDPTALELGDDRWPWSAVERADATDGPPKLILVLRDGTRRVWVASDEHHNVYDLAWLAEQITERAGS